MLKIDLRNHGQNLGMKLMEGYGTDPLEAAISNSLFYFPLGWFNSLFVGKLSHGKVGSSHYVLVFESYSALR